MSLHIFTSFFIGLLTSWTLVSCSSGETERTSSQLTVESLSALTSNSTVHGTSTRTGTGVNVISTGTGVNVINSSSNGISSSTSNSNVYGVATNTSSNGLASPYSANDPTSYGAGGGSMYQVNSQGSDATGTAEQTILNYSGTNRVASATCDGNFSNRQPGDMCGYDFCGNNNSQLSAGEKTTVMALVSYLQKQNMIGTTCQDQDVVNKLQALTSLDLSNSSISDITPLMEMVALQSLILDNNQIVGSLTELEGMVNLTVFHASYNQIFAVDGLSFCSNLTDINLANNNITTVAPIASLSKIVTLDVSNNKIVSIIPFMRNPARTTTPTTVKISGNSGILTEVQADPVAQTSGCNVVNTSGTFSVDGNCLIHYTSSTLEFSDYDSNNN
jgi:Leucine-rich repeat (LRR) protein